MTKASTKHGATTDDQTYFPLLICEKCFPIAGHTTRHRFVRFEKRGAQNYSLGGDIKRVSTIRVHIWACKSCATERRWGSE
jgi:hypothetical protein